MTSVKRTNPFAQYAHQPAPLAKRLKKVETLARHNSPELKAKIFIIPATTAATQVSVVELTSIAQGDNITAREGNKISVKNVEVKGQFNWDVDVYLIKSYGSFVPTYGTFSTAAYGTFIHPDNLNTKVKQLAYYCNQVMPSGDQFMYRKTKVNCIACYDGSSATNCTRNRLHLVIVNPTGAVKNNKGQVMITYTDG